MNGVRLPVEDRRIIIHVSDLDVYCVFHHLRRGGNTFVKLSSKPPPHISCQRSDVSENVHWPQPAEAETGRKEGQCDRSSAGQSRLNVSIFQQLNCVE